MKKLIIICLFICNGIYAQKNNLTLKFGYPIPYSEFSLKNNFQGIIDIDFNYTKSLLCNKLYFGADINYLRLNFYDWAFLKTYINFYNLGITIKKEYLLFKKIDLSPEINIGYSFVITRNNSISKNIMNNYDKKGFFIRPVASFYYNFSKKYSIGLYSTYMIIFSQFGDKNIINDFKEDKTMRYYSLGISTKYKF